MKSSSCLSSRHSFTRRTASFCTCCLTWLISISSTQHPIKIKLSMQLLSSGCCRFWTIRGRIALCAYWSQRLCSRLSTITRFSSITRRWRSLRSSIKLLRTWIEIRTCPLNHRVRKRILMAKALKLTKKIQKRLQNNKNLSSKVTTNRWRKRSEINLSLTLKENS